MTRIRVGGVDTPAYLSVVNSDLEIAGFESIFTEWKRPDIPPWPPPPPDSRLG